MKTPSLHLAGLVGLFVLSVGAVHSKTTEVQTSKDRIETSDVTYSPVLMTAPTMVFRGGVVPCKVPNQKQCR